VLTIVVATVAMAAASLVLPFLPLTAGQILLNNFLSDVPAIGIAGDSVDPELVESPRRWDIRFIGRYMMEFGILSSVFDVATFLTLLVIFHAGPDTFRTGWFVESLLTELAVALVVRTRRPFFKSRPGRLLLVSRYASSRWRCSCRTCHLHACLASCGYQVRCWWPSS
jgi:P-type Mg2+ transporter